MLNYAYALMRRARRVHKNSDRREYGQQQQNHSAAIVSAVGANDFSLDASVFVKFTIYLSVV